MKRILRNILNKKRVVIPLLVLLLVSSLSLLFVSSMTMRDGEKKMNKYDNLDDQTAYVIKSYSEYQEIKTRGKYRNTVAFYQKIEIDGEGNPILYIASSSGNHNFGIPYLEGSFIDFPKEIEPIEGSFYCSYETSDNRISLLEKEFTFSKKIFLDIPYLNIYEEKHPIERICLCVCNEEAMSGQESLLCCFDCLESKNTFFFPSDSIGRNIKEKYLKENSSFYLYVQIMSAIPYVSSCILIVILSSILFMENRRNTLIIAFYSKKRVYGYIDSLIRWFTILGVPISLGILGYIAICQIGKLPINSLIAFISFFVVACCVFFFSILENRKRRKWIK